MNSGNWLLSLYFSEIPACTSIGKITPPPKKQKNIWTNFLESKETLWNRYIYQIIAALKWCQRSWRQPNTGFIRGKEKTDISTLTSTTQLCLIVSTVKRWAADGQYSTAGRKQVTIVWRESSLLTYCQLYDAHLALWRRQDFRRLVCQGSCWTTETKC